MRILSRYVKSQLHPPLARLLIPIEGTDNAKIAEALGMDASKFQAAFGSGAEFGGVAFAGEDTSALIDQLVNPLTKWKSKHLVFDIACPACQKGAPLRQILGLNEDLRPTGERVLCCPHCDAFLGGARVCQQVGRLCSLHRPHVPARDPTGDINCQSLISCPHFLKFVVVCVVGDLGFVGR